ncbi:MAG: glycosyltransferase family 4 protein [Clostridia bacterium]|nr:glycosyltransferase family 4 protein [Clostridia bacterium]
MKKLLLIAECLSGGVRRHVLDLLNGLDTAKYQITFLYSSNRADSVFLKEMEELRKRINLIEVKFLRRAIHPYHDYLAYRQIRNIIRKVKPDIVHCHSSKAGLVGRLAARREKVATILYTPHAYMFQSPELSQWKRKSYALAEMMLSRLATTFTLNVSKGEKEMALSCKLDRAEKFMVIPNGIPREKEEPDKQAVRKQLGLPEGIKIVGCAARFDKQKDPHTFIRIAETMFERHQDILFCFIGDGEYLDELRKRVTEKGLEKRILLPGFRADAAKWLEAFDAYLLTSLYEGLPYALIEALRARLPIVATRATGNTELVSDGVNGYLFELRNSEDGAFKLDMLLKDAAKARSMAEESYRLYVENYSLKSMLARLEAVYDAIPVSADAMRWMPY